jgi:hypothetical protein
VQTGGALNVTGQFSNTGTTDVFGGTMTAGSINNSRAHQRRPYLLQPRLTTAGR